MTPYRTLLFAPGDNPHRMIKAASSAADAVVFDLEDAVVTASKPTARTAVLQALSQIPEGRAFVRLNTVGSSDYFEDLRALAPALGRATGLIVPKVESVEQLVRLDTDLRSLGGFVEATPLPVLAVLESAAGILAAAAIAGGPRVRGLIFGTLDLAAELGVSPTVAGTEFLHARSQVVLASRGAGLAGPLDGPHPRVDEPQELAQSARTARALGFRGKVVLHPAQIDPVHQAFTSTESELAHARAVIDAFRQAQGDGLGVVRLPDGTFIDRPVVVRAAALLGLNPEEVHA